MTKAQEFLILKLVEDSNYLQKVGSGPLLEEFEEFLKKEEGKYDVSSESLQKFLRGFDQSRVEIFRRLEEFGKRVEELEGAVAWEKVPALCDKMEELEKKIVDIQGTGSPIDDIPSLRCLVDGCIRDICEDRDRLARLENRVGEMEEWDEVEKEHGPNNP